MGEKTAPVLDQRGSVDGLQLVSLVLDHGRNWKLPTLPWKMKKNRRRSNSTGHHCRQYRSKYQMGISVMKLLVPEQAWDELLL